MVDAEKLLRIYLNDHSAGSITGIEVAKRCLSSNEGTPLGEFLRTFIVELEEDRAELTRVMRALGFSQDRLKEGMGWAVEKVGRLKLNGRVRSYSPLSRVFELEGLKLGVAGKLSLWRSLKEIQGTDSRLGVVDLDRLEKRAERQLEELEVERLDAVNRAFR